MPRTRSALRDQLEYGAFRVLLSGVGLVSDDTLDALGRLLGRLGAWVLPRRRALAARNLLRAGIARDEDDAITMATSVFEHFGAVALDLLRSTAEPPGALLSRVTVTGEEHARRAFESGRGMFFLTAHLGNWELAALTTAACGLPMTVIVRPLDNPHLDAHLTAFRTRTGNRVQAKREAAREILRVLRSGGCVGILLDQNVSPPEGIVVPFFGRPASTSPLVARLAERTGALVVPSAAYQVAPRRYRVEFHPPLDVRALPAADRTPEALTARLNQLLEERIRRAPAQWLWLHNRWRWD